MIQLKPVKLPKEFIKILQFDPLSSKSSRDAFTRIIHQSEFLPLLIQKTFSHIHPNGTPLYFWDLLGHKTFRDRLASVFLQYTKNQSYPNETNLNYVEDILKEETLYQQFTMAGHSRLFLFFYYLETIRIPNYKNASQYNIPKNLLHYLKQSKQKIWYIDYIIIILWHFHQYLGEKKLTQFFSYLSPFRNYPVLWRQLKLEEQKNLTKNLIHYSYSIGDDRLFQHYL